MKHKFSFLVLLLFTVLANAQVVPDEFYFVNVLKTIQNTTVTKIIQDEVRGNFIVAGHYVNTISLDPAKPTAITHTAPVPSLINSFVAMYSHDGGYLWSTSLHATSGTSGDVLIRSIEVGKDGSIYAVGYFSTENMNSSYASAIITPVTKTTGVNGVGFLIKFNPYNEADSHQFIRTVGNETTANFTEINDCKYLVMSNREILLLAGDCVGSNIDINLDNNPSATSLVSTNPSTSVGFITAVNEQGQALVSLVPLTISGANSGHNVIINKLAIANREVSNTTETFIFGGTFGGVLSAPYSNVSNGNSDILFGTASVSINLSSGLPVSVTTSSVKSIGSPGQDDLADIAINSAQSKIFIAGNYNGASMDLDLSMNTQDIGPSNGIDGFMVEYDSSYMYKNMYKFYDAGTQEISAIHLWDTGGDTILVAGNFNGSSVTYGSMSINNLSTSADFDAFAYLIKTGPGSPVGLKSFHIGGTEYEYINAICVSDFYEAIFGGQFKNTVDFDNSSAVYQVNANFPSGFMVVYGENLDAFVDSYSSGDPDDEITQLSIDGKGDIFAIGTYTGSINIGSSTLNSAGGTDVFIQRKNRNGTNQWAFNAGRMASSGYNITDICAKINSTANDKARGVVASDTSIYIAYTRNDTAYVQRINKNTGTAQWTQKINKNGSNIGGITADAQFVYIVGDSAGVQMTQRINKNTGTAQWTQKSPGGKGKAITQDNEYVYAVKDSSGHVVVARINKNTGTAQWTQRIAGNSGSSIATVGDDLYMMSDSSGTIVLKKINKNTGTAQWTQKVGSGTLGNVSVSPGKGAVYITGTFTGTSAYLGLTSTGSTDGFVARINKNTGTAQWTQRVGGPGADSIKTLEVTAGNDIYIGGNTQGGTFGTSTASAGVFLVRLSVDSLDRATSITPMTIQADAFECQIYPNPTRDMFNISATLPKTELVQIRIVDLMGRIVHQEMFGNQNNIQNTVDIGEFPNGVYILQIQAGNKQVIRKIIKQ